VAVNPDRAPAAAGQDAEVGAAPWHTREPDDVFTSLETRASGLTEGEAARRLARYGPNELPQEPPPSPWKILLRQFKSPLIYILVIAAVIALAAGDYPDAGFIGLVLLVNAFVGGYQEWKAERSSRALQALLEIRATVIREGSAKEIPSDQLVAGDVVLLESGERIPADLRLTASHGLEVDESLLTGESIAVRKDAGWLGDTAAPIADRQNMCFAGSIVARGRAEGVVVETGSRTTIGRLAIDVMRASGGRTPLLERMAHFSHVVAVVVLVTAVVIGLLATVIHDYGLFEVVLFGIALAVAAIPEGLPITITVALAVATTRMARRGVIVRRLAAVEGLGSCTMIVSDKTGTLTVNELTVRAVRLADGTEYEVTGEGFAPEGQVQRAGRTVLAGEHPELAELAAAAALCNEASLHPSDGSWRFRGDPTDIALLALVRKLGWQREQLLSESPRINEIPFEAEHRFSASYHERHGAVTCYVKGAPERVLSMCDLDESARDAAIDASRHMAERGFRVLALAVGKAPGLDREATPEEPSGLRLAGFAGMIDPLREGVREAVTACQQAGIRVYMATGDHPVTALAIARELGMAERPEQVITGTDLTATTRDDLRVLLERVRVFARVVPSQKLDIVEAARASGHFVAVTGDGVNDAPALRAAHIGVAMGKAGTDVARESSELVISDDNFATIVAGVEEGRVAYDNIRKVIFLLISTGAAEVLLLGLAVASGVPLPLLPAQILWLNLVTSGIQDKPLALEPPEGNVLRRRPRAPGEPIFDRLMIERAVVVAVTMAGLGYGAFLWMLDRGFDEASARNGLLLFLVLMKTFHLGAARSETEGAFAVSPWRNPVLVACAAAAMLVHVGAMYWSPTQAVLQTEPVSWELFVALAAAGTLVFVVMELHKWIWRLRHPAPARA
jgi:P-type Ca2+ transporter type 2C